MFIQNIKLENFRNFKNLDLSLNQGFVVLFGENGAGKTNFLEAVYYTDLLQRFPENDFGQLFLDGETYFRTVVEKVLNGEVFKDEGFAEKTDSGYRYKFVHAGKTVTRAEYIKSAAIVSFLPSDLDLFSRSPSRRRKFLDNWLLVGSPAYGQVLTQYEKTLRQRNNLLRDIQTGKTGVDGLEIWDQQLAHHGSEIISARSELINFFNEHAGEILQKIAPEIDDVIFQYLNSGETETERFLMKLKESLAREQVLGTTTIGPHRDDFMALLDDKKIIGRISRGQLRSIILGLKTLQKTYIEKKRNTEAIILLDDVFSEFDVGHQQHLTEFLESFEQTFITTAHLEEVKKFLPESVKQYNVVDGGIKQ